MRAVLTRVALLQDTLRQAIRRVIEEPDFRAIFKDDERIEQTFGG